MCFAAIMAGSSAQANPAAIEAFAAHCFSPFLTAETATMNLAASDRRIDFYDLDPLSNVAPSMTDQPAPGTDRRCEVAFSGNTAAQAVNAVVDALDREGIVETAPVPSHYTASEGTALLAARYLNPNRIAVVHVGTRPGPNGVETHMTVERLTPLNQ